MNNIKKKYLKEIYLKLKESKNPIVWKIFFKKLVPVWYDKNYCYFLTESKFYKNWILSKYKQDILHIIRKIIGKKLDIYIYYNKSNKKKIKAKNRDSFQTFIIGKENEMTLKACKEVVLNLGILYNPLFLFGKIGVGKTHLLSAIALESKQRYPKLKILHMHAEEWMNLFIRSLEERNMRNFRNQFRNECDLLLLDNIGFFSNKKATLEEFLHTFDTLLKMNKQIIVTSDKMPREMSYFSKDLISRLGWGLVLEIKESNNDTKMRIIDALRKKDDIYLSKNMAKVIINRKHNSIRDIEGYINRLKLTESVTNEEITLRKVNIMIKNEEESIYSLNLTKNILCLEVANVFNIDILEVLGRSREKDTILARQIAIYLCRNILNLTLTQIGSYFSGRTHSTVSSLLNKFNQIKENNLNISNILGQLKKRLKE